MATIKYCPECKTGQECIKKGKKASGEQLWQCKKCSKRFTAITDPETKPKKESPKKESPKKVGKTIIYINNNAVKEVPGMLETEDALSIVGSYFKDLSKDKATIKDAGDVRTITFSINVGTKN
jgi:hypothetical protein